MIDSRPLRLRGDALLVVDVQRNFLPGGALGVPGGDAVIGPLNEALAVCARHGVPVFATRDWHPPDPLFLHYARRCVAASLPGA
jgi:nicotinamidase/pyrazinamidase